jgi:hypothetical protein
MLLKPTAVALLLVVSLSLASRPAHGQECLAKQKVCNGTCVSLNKDPNCGDCGVICRAGERCTAGEDGIGSCVCQPGYTKCNGVCRDISNPQACGTANSGGFCTVVSCPTTQVCNNGTCGCATNLTLCEGSCVNTEINLNHCGACGSFCRGNQICVGAKCGCPSGLTLCGSMCVDTSTDNANCGECGKAVPFTKICRGGLAVCQIRSTVSCNGRCVDLNTDLGNCGECGKACPRGQTCTGGKCSCLATQVQCGGKCVNLLTDKDNCGVCG